jgi:hypothetical protein
MFLDTVDPALASVDTSLLFPSGAHMRPNIISATSQHIATDPQLEAELLTDVSHVALDLTTFVSPNTAWIRFCNVLGRILVVSSDYVQDHYISPDEALFQAIMLTISTQMFLRSAWPVILAASSKTSLSVRDRRSFTQLFSKVGLSALQYKTLLTSNALEWVELESSEQVHLNGDHMYYLYSGDISSSLHEHSTSSKENATLHTSQRMFGDVVFAKTLEETMFKDKKKKSKPDKLTSAEESSPVLNETLTAGSQGAVLLQVSTSKLLKAMKHDAELSDSINRLVLLCMQEKLASTFQKDTWKSNRIYQSTFTSLESTPNATAS